MLDHMLRKANGNSQSRLLLMVLKRDKCQCPNYILFKQRRTYKKKENNNVESDIILLMGKMVKTKILMDFKFYKEMKPGECFKNLDVL